MKKILCDFQNSKGGAPRSHLEHAKALSEMGHEIVAVISKESKADFFEGTDFKIYYLSNFKTGNVFQNLRLLKKYYDIIRFEDIDLIYANRVVQCYFLSILSDFIGLPILNARAGGSLSKKEIEDIQRNKHKPFIVYSKENLETFKKAGFTSNRLFLISNRLPSPTSSKITNKILEEELIITLTGNIKEDTLHGLLWFFKFLEQIIFQSEYKITVNIAGENRIKNVSKRKLFEKQLKIIQEVHPEVLSVKHLGWVNNVTKLQSESHICIGKGRSIIEPAMMGKISFVISELGTLYRCKRDSYKDLYYYNFSGRGNIYEKEKSLNEFTQLIKGKSFFYKKMLNESNSIKDKFKEDYSFDYLSDKLKYAISSITKINRDISKGFGNYIFKYYNKYIWLFKSKFFNDK